MAASRSLRASFMGGASVGTGGRLGVMCWEVLGVRGGGPGGGGAANGPEAGEEGRMYPAPTAGGPAGGPMGGIAKAVWDDGMRGAGGGGGWAEFM